LCILDDDPYGTGFSKLRATLNPLCFTLFMLFFAFIKNAYIEAGTRPPIFVLPSAGSGTVRAHASIPQLSLIVRMKF
jgi:hypothetical protein